MCAVGNSKAAARAQQSEAALLRLAVASAHDAPVLGRVPFASPSHWPAQRHEACVTAMREGRNPFAEPELASRTLDMTCPEYRSTRPTTRRAKISLGWVEGQSLVLTWRDGSLYATGKPLNPQEPFRVILVIRSAAFHGRDFGIVQTVRTRS